MIENPFTQVPGFNCFACGPSHPTGLKLKFYEEDEKVKCRFKAREDLTGFSNIVHGGIQATLLDEVMWWAAFHSAGHLCLTHEMKLELLAPARPDMELLISGSVLRQRKARAETQGEIHCGDQLLARAHGVYVYPTLPLLARTLGVPPDKVPSDLQKYVLGGTTCESR